MFYRAPFKALVAQTVKHLPEGQAEGDSGPIPGSGRSPAEGAHSSTRAWKIPWMEEAGRLQSVGSQRVGNNWATSLWLSSKPSLVAQMVKICLQCRRPMFNPWIGKIPWRRERQPSPVFLPEKSHGWRRLVGYSPWGCKESDITEQLHFHFPAYLSCYLNTK